MFTSAEIKNAADAARRAVSKVRAGGKSKAIVPATPREVETFAVGGAPYGSSAPVPNGGGCGGRCGGGNGGYGSAAPCDSPRSAMCRPGSFNSCYWEVAQRHKCPLKVCSGGVRDLAAVTGISFRIQPTLSNWFLPIAIRAVSRDAAAPSTVLVGRITAVTINGVPQEIYNNTSPTAASVDGVEINAYFGKTGVGDEMNIPAYEVAWGPFSRDSMADQLQITVFNDDVALAADIRIEVWGFPISSLPDGWTAGNHPAKQMPAAA